MKTDRLPELDLARISVLPVSLQYQELWDMTRGFTPDNYNPFRDRELDIFNAQAGPLALLPPMPPAQILREIALKCRSKKQRGMNLRVARGACHFVAENHLEGERHEFMPLGLGAAGKVIYWLPMVVVIDGRPTVPFINPRIQASLDPQSRRFVFSVMKERIRKLGGDYADVRLAILEFEKPIMGVRKVVPYYDDGLDLYSFDDLAKMVKRVYETYGQVIIDRRAA